MPHRQRHRGKHPSDLELFGSSHLNKLTAAVDDLIYLLGRGYASQASIKLVGDRYQLKKRQRLAVERTACTDDQRLCRQSKLVSDVAYPETVCIDGYNLLITVECGLSDGIILLGRDGAYRDLASVHGSYKKVVETVPALDVIGTALATLGVKHAVWFLDKPVSNSGLLAQLIRETGASNNWEWGAEVVFNPDKRLVEADAPVISSDSWILDNCQHWANLMGHLINDGHVSCRPLSL